MRTLSPFHHEFYMQHNKLLSIMGERSLVNFTDCRIPDFYLWDPKTQALSQCLFRVCIQIPIFGVLAISSAYYTGRRSVNYLLFTSWNRWQSSIIYIRAFVVSILAIFPLLGLALNLGLDHPLGFTEIVLSIVKSTTWLIHLCYTLQLKRGISYNCRGPKPIIVFWLASAVISALDFRKQYVNRYFTGLPELESEDPHSFQLYSSGLEALLQFIYLLSLIPHSIHLDQGQYRSLLTDSPSDLQGTINNESNLYIGFHEDDGPIYLGIAKENSGLLSKLLFLWVNRLMLKGSCGYLTHSEDLFELPPKLSTSYVTSSLQDRTKNLNGAFIRGLASYVGIEFGLIGILKLAADICAFCGPLLLNLLITYIEEGGDSAEETDLWTGYMYVFGMFASSLVGSLCGIHFDMNMTEVCLKIRAAIVTSIYRKTLLLRKTSFDKFNAGEIINFLNIDTDRIINFCPSFHSVWSLPLQIAIALYLLYTQLGLAFLAGLFFAILLIPINKVIARKIGEYSTTMMQHKDQRVKIMSEILHGIRSLKFHSWESFFAQRINNTRKLELSALKGRKYLDALCVYFWATTPVLVSILSFGTYILLGNQLTAAKVFTSLALFNMLIGPLNALPWVINGVIEALVSVKRVSVFLNTEETEPNEVYCPISPGRIDSTLALSVSNATFAFGSPDTSRFSLGGISLDVKQGQLIGIVGEVGAGKSSLLLSLLGELSITSGTMSMRNPEDGFGVVFQDPWIQRGNIRRNILFGKPYDAGTYNEVIKACCLLQDLEELEDGDYTLCSANTLSGGQKLRITLARAIYQDKPIYLLDDIFAAVDANVAKQLYRRCIMGILKRKTRILVTHHVKYLREADIILVMDNGRVINRGLPEEILPVFFDEDMSDDLLSGSTKESTSSPKLRSLASKSMTDSVRSDDTVAWNESLARSAEFINRQDSLLVNSDAQEERKCEGSISMTVYKAYWQAVGPRVSVGILLFLFLMQATKNCSDFWLAHWVTVSNRNSTPTFIETDMDDVVNDFETVTVSHSLPILDFTNNSSVTIRPKRSILGNDGSDTNYYLLIFILIGVANSFSALGRAFLFAYGAIEGGRRLHMRLLRVILKAKMLFFDQTPIGRIINRFSSDVSTVDDSLPFILNILLAQLFGLLGTLVLTSYALPWILVLILPLLLVVNNIQMYYRHTARQCRRVASISLSPIYAHFSETIRGIITIRATRSSRRFEHENEIYVECNQKARYSMQAVSQWLSFRLQMVGVLVITGVGIIGVMQHGLGVANTGIIGLAISYALTITGSLSGFVTSFTETEKEMVAVERVHEYITEVEGECRAPSAIALPYLWPSQGVISFKDVSLRYRRGNAYALRNITFETGPCEKIGIVGRTGAGKSSLFHTLFRVVDDYEGEITIDSVDIKQTSLKDLRSKLWIVPQDPLIFSGTLRENLNPKGDFSDESIIRVVQKCQLSGLVRQLGGLSGDVGEGGSCLSAGQKQLVQLARAMLINPKILCIDEATANIDHDTDKIIQATIRTSFRTSTVLTVTHRVTSVLHSHRVIVMKNGSILEIDAPEKLMIDKSSHFYQLAQGNN